jgi:gluconate 5-dehydrogenase
MRFDGRVGVVTGGGSGIGRAIALRLASEGCAVAVVDMELDRAKQVAGEIEAAGGAALAVSADISSLTDTRRIATETDARFGRLDILINNAGIRPIAPFLELELSLWQRALDVMLTGPMLCSQAAIPLMLRQGKGKIVNIASVTGMLALTQRAAYAAAKAGLIGLTKALAFELSSKQIYVNAVAPGMTETPLNAPYFQDPAMAELLRRELPLGRWGQPGEIANVVAFLASDESDYVCGSTWAVDGGWTSGKGY